MLDCEKYAEGGYIAYHGSSDLAWRLGGRFVVIAIICFIYGVDMYYIVYLFILWIIKIMEFGVLCSINLETEVE